MYEVGPTEWDDIFIWAINNISILIWDSFIYILFYTVYVSELFLGILCNILVQFEVILYTFLFTTNFDYETVKLRSECYK